VDEPADRWEVVMSQQTDVTQEGRRLGGGAIASLSGLAVLIIFIVQNTQDVAFQFLFLSFTWPLWLYTIVVAVFTAAARSAATADGTHARRTPTISGRSTPPPAGRRSVLQTRWASSDASGTPRIRRT
jgi:hypothetical protein